MGSGLWGGGEKLLDSFFLKSGGEITRIIEKPKCRKNICSSTSDPLHTFVNFIVSPSKGAAYSLLGIFVFSVTLGLFRTTGLEEARMRM